MSCIIGWGMSITPDQISKFHSLFDSAENAIHRIEPLPEGLLYAPVNQLRYAANHFLMALDPAPDSNPKYDFDSACRHCKRAIYDAFDAGIVFLLEDRRMFQNDYRGVVVSEVIPEYIKIHERAMHAKKMIDEARALNDDRQKYYKEADKYFDILTADNGTLNVAREELNKVIRKHNTNIYRFWFGIITGLLALSLTIYEIMQKATP